MILALLAPPALATDFTIGKGRAAVVALDIAPTSIAISKSSVLEVVPSPPYLILGGRAPGVSVITLEHEGGAREWSVTVKAAPDTEATGLDALVSSSEPLALRPDEGVLCTLDVTPRATTLLDERAAQVEPFGPNRYFVQAQALGVVDLVFERGTEPPRVFTLRTTPEGGAAAPRGCVVPEVVKVPVGGEVTVDVGKRIGALLVGHPERIEALRVEGAPTSLTVLGHKPGVTTLLVREGDRDVPWVRRVVVTE
jgi:hypothetical protein